METIRRRYNMSFVVIAVVCVYYAFELGLEPTLNLTLFWYSERDLTDTELQSEIRTRK